MKARKAYFRAGPINRKPRDTSTLQDDDFPPDHDHPEHDLLRALLSQAYRDWFPPSRNAESKEQHWHRQAIAWFEDKSGAAWSFRWVAHCLHLDPDVILIELESRRTREMRKKIRSVSNRQIQIPHEQ